MIPAIKMQNINIMLHYAPCIYETCKLQIVNKLHASSVWVCDETNSEYANQSKKKFRTRKGNHLEQFSTTANRKTVPQRKKERNGKLNCMCDSLFWFEHVLFAASSSSSNIGGGHNKTMLVHKKIIHIKTNYMTKFRISYRVTERQRNEKGLSLGPRMKKRKPKRWLCHICRRDGKSKHFNRKIDKIRQTKRSTKWNGKKKIKWKIATTTEERQKRQHKIALSTDICNALRTHSSHISHRLMP